MWQILGNTYYRTNLALQLLPSLKFLRNSKEKKDLFTFSFRLNMVHPKKNAHTHILWKYNSFHKVHELLKFYRYKFMQTCYMIHSKLNFENVLKYQE